MNETKKEVVSKKTAKPKQEKKEITYFQADKFSFSDLKKTFPKELEINTRVIEIFSWILIIVILLSIFQIPFNSLLSDSADKEMGIGLPWAFLSFDLAGSGDMIIEWKGALLDLLVYFIAAYIIHVVIGLFFGRLKNLGKGKHDSLELYKVNK